MLTVFSALAVLYKFAKSGAKVIGVAAVCKQKRLKLLE